MSTSARRSLGGATALVTFSACCFGSISVLTLVGTRAGASLTALMFWRYLPAGLLLFIIARRRARGASLPAWMVAVGGVGQALTSILTLTALKWVSAAMVGFLFYTYPAWIALIGAARGTERVDRRRAVSLALSFGGIALMIGAPRGGVGADAWPGVALGLASAVTYALYVPFLHRLEAMTSPARASAVIALGAGLIFLALAAADGTLTVHLAPSAWGAAAVLSLVCTVAAFMTFLRGLAKLGPVRTAIVATVEPFWTALLGAAVLGQPITATTLAGGALIATAVVLLHLEPAARTV